MSGRVWRRFGVVVLFLLLGRAPCRVLLLLLSSWIRRLRLIRLFLLLIRCLLLWLWWVRVLLLLRFLRVRHRVLCRLSLLLRLTGRLLRRWFLRLKSLRLLFPILVVRLLVSLWRFLLRCRVLARLLLEVIAMWWTIVLVLRFLAWLVLLRLPRRRVLRLGLVIVFILCLLRLTRVIWRNRGSRLTLVRLFILKRLLFCRRLLRRRLALLSRRFLNLIVGCRVVLVRVRFTCILVLRPLLLE